MIFTRRKKGPSDYKSGEIINTATIVSLHYCAQGNCFLFNQNIQVLFLSWTPYCVGQFARDMLINKDFFLTKWFAIHLDRVEGWHSWVTSFLLPVRLLRADLHIHIQARFSSEEVCGDINPRGTRNTPQFSTISDSCAGPHQHETKQARRCNHSNT